ncbi:CelD/BcsL family acetyltransferase involved in cellulose biosynthesis [Massilia sp. MP_M2]|uniref:GNAT family N-acetyltransferase n=1 Tax=Massilia sp. MP_M2 TaxID=3071713 RepID=UPI00319E887B
MTLRLLTGDAVLAHIATPRFVTAWRALHAICPWASACQHADFVLPWYGLYAGLFVPVVVVQEADDGALVGLLPLALDEKGQRVTGAGERHAEYQGWLQPPDADASFITGALRAIREHLPRADLVLRYLPAGTPLSWLNAWRAETRGTRRWVTLRTVRRPLMQIDTVAMTRQRNKKNHRQNVNRLGRLGAVRFEQVTEHEHFLRVVDAICDQYDFRQAALYRDRPFALDAAKKRFYIALHRQGLLHVTVLTVGGEVAASHIGLLSAGRAVHLGINTYHPATSAHSPGNLLLAMLGVHLATQQMPLLDLTPGGDGYKEHFATAHDQVSVLTIHRDLRSLLLTAARQCLAQAARALAVWAGWRRHDVLAIVHGIRPQRWASAAAGWSLRRARPEAISRILRPGPSREIAGALLPSRDSLPDVLQFDADGAAWGYCAFLNTAMKRMERSEHFYSLVQDNRLALLCWVSGGTAGVAMVLSGLYVHRQCTQSDLVEAFIAGVVQDVRRRDPHSAIYYQGSVSAELDENLARCGFSPANLQQEQSACMQAH